VWDLRIEIVSLVVLEEGDRELLEHWGETNMIWYAHHVYSGASECRRGIMIGEDLMVAIEGWEAKGL
jgi:hypothetical protein